MARVSSYDRLVESLVGLVNDGVASGSPRVERGTVMRSSPLIVDLGDDVVIEEGDPDVEFDRGVLASRPAVGEAVRVHFDGQDWIVSGVIQGGED